MAWRPSCEQGGRSSVLVAPIRVAGQRFAVAPALHGRRDEGSRSVRPIPRARGSATRLVLLAVASPATLVRLAGHRRNRTPPSGARTPGSGAAAHTSRTARPARTLRLRARDPGSRAPQGGSPRNVPIGTPRSLQAATAAGRREERATGHPRQRRRSQGDWIPATPKQRRPSRGTGYRPPPTASNATSELRSAWRPVARRQGWKAVTRQGARLGERA
jgi:hypothetical protein